MWRADGDNRRTGSAQPMDMGLDVGDAVGDTDDMQPREHATGLHGFTPLPDNPLEQDCHRDHRDDR
jgi:hypothetical protein